MTEPEVWWSHSLAEDLSQGGLIERTGPDLWHQEHGTWQRLDELPADAVRMVPDTGQARPAKSSRSVYVRVRNVLRAGLRTEQITDTVALDWEPCDDGEERLVGVEVLDARGAEIDGLDVVTGRAHGTAPDTVQAPDVAALAYARSEVDKWLADNDPYCILPTRTEHIPALLARLDELEGTR